MNWVRRHFSICALIASTWFLLGCSGSRTLTDPAPPQQPVVSVAVTPTRLSMDERTTRQFSATVSGTSDQRVAWSIQEGASGGTITPEGLYTAPGSSGDFHIVATSKVDSAQAAVAVVTVRLVEIGYLYPNPVGLARGQRYQFFVYVSSGSLQWSIAEGQTGGSITQEGIYTAPNTLGTFHILATSVVNPTRSTTATIEVLPTGFSPTGTMKYPRAWGSTATLLRDGRVLVAGGVPLDGGTVVSGVELYDPNAGTFSETGALSQPRYWHTATLLPDNTVLIAGGRTGVGFATAAEIYDPVSGSFRTVGNIAKSRVGHAAVLLDQTRVLLVGGAGADALTAEIYDATTRSFTPVGDLSAIREFPTASRLNDGRVLIAGGDDGSLSSCKSWASTEIFNPLTRAFSPGPELTSARTVHSATVLPDGRIFIAGGNPSGSDGEWCDWSPLATAEIISADAAKVSAPVSMAVPRAGHTASLLPDGVILLAGGESGFLVSEIVNPANGASTLAGASINWRFMGTATVLLDGRVLITSGGSGMAELYDPR